MPSIKYIARVIRGMRFDKLNHMMDVVKEKSGHGKVRTFCDMLWCGLRYGAGYYDYVMFGFYAMTGRQRNTYLTRVRNKKVCELMNDYSISDEFDDKLRFNARFSEFIGRKYLDAEHCSLADFEAFISGQEDIFAKPNHGDCGRGIEKLHLADFPDAAAILEYAHGKQLSVLEHCIRQHPHMARLNPSSVNSLRIVTDLVDNTVHIAYIMVKIGTGGGCCDNTGQGGVLCRVDEARRRICSVATDDYFHVYEKHPDTGIVFMGYEIPMLQEAISLAKKAAFVLPKMRHVGWDIAVTEDGHVIIEGNEYPGTDLCQLAPHYPEKQGLWPYYKKLLKL
ncbi:MAG: hypothetical protein IJB35_04170 [Oscillospiraceae bacterium]|nr:hypothetical protein [Oscillospiraceae bacterium]